MHVEWSWVLSAIAGIILSIIGNLLTAPVWRRTTVMAKAIGSLAKAYRLVVLAQRIETVARISVQPGVGAAVVGSRLAFLALANLTCLTIAIVIISRPDLTPPWGYLFAALFFSQSMVTGYLVAQSILLAHDALRPEATIKRLIARADRLDPRMDAALGQVGIHINRETGQVVVAADTSWSIIRWEPAYQAASAREGQDQPARQA